MSSRMETLLRIAADQRASDLHLHAGKIPRVRHEGRFKPLPLRALGMHQLRTMLDEILDDRQRAHLEKASHLDFAYEIPGTARFRGSICMQSDGPSAVFRVIPPSVAPLDSLELPAAISGLTRHSHGLVLVTGPTGSGKTTTLAAIVDRINESTARHVLTIEDPIEFVHTNKRGLITQRQVGLHTESFAAALRSALREAPDVIVVGEIRDYETIALALSAAEAGVLVFATLHTRSAPQSVERLLGACPDDRQDEVREVLATLLRGVVCQRMCRAIGGGRVAACEILLHSIAVSNLIREKKAHLLDGVLRGGAEMARGMRSLEESLSRLVKEKRVTRGEAMSVANDPKVLAELLGPEAE
jgi:twitching motility protein PilT